MARFASTLYVVSFLLESLRLNSIHFAVFAVDGVEAFLMRLQYSCRTQREGMSFSRYARTSFLGFKPYNDLTFYRLRRSLDSTWFYCHTRRLVHNPSSQLVLHPPTLAWERQHRSHLVADASYHDLRFPIQRSLRLHCRRRSPTRLRGKKIVFCLDPGLRLNSVRLYRSHTRHSR